MEQKCCYPQSLPEQSGRFLVFEPRRGLAMRIIDDTMSAEQFCADRTSAKKGSD